MPEVATLDELNDKIRAWEHDDNTRRITGHANTIGQDHHAELPTWHRCRPTTSTPA